MGIKKVHHPDELWELLNTLGDRQSYYVLEKFVAGDVYHVDSMVWDGRVVFAATHKYGLPPMTVYQGGGVFVSSSLPYHSLEDQALQAINREVINAMGMVRGVTHAEFIRGAEDGQYYFLEIAARVGGAGIDQLVQYATDLNPWVEWARVELAELRGEEYRLPPIKHGTRASSLPWRARNGPTPPPTTIPSWCGGWSRSTMWASSSLRRNMGGSSSW